MKRIELEVPLLEEAVYKHVARRLALSLTHKAEPRIV